MSDPTDQMPEYDELPPWPSLIDPARLPAHLRENPAMQAYLRLPQERREMLARLAKLTEAEDEAAANTPMRELLARLG